MLDWYRLVMDEERNPLRNLAPVQKFQIMTILSLAWTAIFCAAASAWYWYGEIVVVHLLLALGILITGTTFHSVTRMEPERDRRLPARGSSSDDDRGWR